MSLSEQLRPSIPLTDVDARSTPGFDGDMAEAKAALKQIRSELAELQERLYANGLTGDHRSVLLVLQGMDTSGKGGVIEKVAGAVNPQGVAITTFKKPTEDELAHDFLWRINKALPAAGKIGVFDRSHYEDVLIVRVHNLQPEGEIERRYEAINEFEQAYVEGGGTIVKCLLHVDKATQKERLAARLEDPEKYYKYRPGDLDERAVWDAYTEAYQLVLDRCSTDIAPWHVVPSGHKPYRNWAVATLLLEALRDLKLEWPAPPFDIEAEKKRVAAL
ncbi:MAG TPA: PPK2 family polyphosphate kinase [Aeromicrobium sp.]|nr:PPK2 family polyphosphate kinase [Aeromicrobium sp.]HKY57264.1 PPK2 family polyphosphate kinase [Aeromicrobium sp.]